MPQCYHGGIGVYVLVGWLCNNFRPKIQSGGSPLFMINNMSSRVCALITVDVSCLLSLLAASHARHHVLFHGCYMEGKENAGLR